MKNWVEVSDIKLWAYHGCLEEERIIGSDYLVQIKVQTDFSKAAKTDNLHDAVDYVKLYQIVKEEMSVPANLLETVAYRIVESVKNNNDNILNVYVKISKLNPPIDGNAQAVSVSIED